MLACCGGKDSEANSISVLLRWNACSVHVSGASKYVWLYLLNNQLSTVQVSYLSSLSFWELRPRWPHSISFQCEIAFICTYIHIYIYIHIRAVIEMGVVGWWTTIKECVLWCRSTLFLRGLYFIGKPPSECFGRKDQLFGKVQGGEWVNHRKELPHGMSIGGIGPDGDMRCKRLNWRFARYFNQCLCMTSSPGGGCEEHLLGCRGLLCWCFRINGAYFLPGRVSECLDKVYLWSR